MTKLDFVQKLLDILTNEQQVVKWNQAGTQFQIINKDEFTHRILPCYFRHDKFQSFIRQLNMYGFHKVNRRKGVNIFKHENFKRDDQNALENIKRCKKKKKQTNPHKQKSTEIEKEANRLNQRAPNVAELLRKLVDFNLNPKFDHKSLKFRLDRLTRQISVKKGRLIRPIISEIRQKINKIDEIHEKIEDLNWRKDRTPKKQTQTQLIIEKDGRPRKIMSTPLISTFQKKSDKISPMKMSIQPFSLNNIRSFNSISNFLQ